MRSDISSEANNGTCMVKKFNALKTLMRTEIMM